MKQKEICEIIKEILPVQGVKKNIADRTDVFRTDDSQEKAPFSYSQSIIIILQGKKRVYIGDSVLTYDPMHYLVLSIPLPVDCDVIASKEHPVLGITIHVDAALVNELMVTAKMATETHKELAAGIYSDEMNEQMSDAVYRLVKTFIRPSENKILAPMYIREIVYRVMTSPNGTALRMLAYRNQAFFKIEHILERIHGAYNQKYDINSLAEEADMSISSFHAAFKAITDMSPLQYIKKIKLHKAREFITVHGCTASAAAYQVGYESTSQFTREYKRMFGVTPSRQAF